MRVRRQLGRSLLSAHCGRWPDGENVLCDARVSFPESKHQILIASIVPFVPVLTWVLSVWDETDPCQKQKRWIGENLTATALPPHCHCIATALPPRCLRIATAQPRASTHSHPRFKPLHSHIESMPIALRISLLKALHILSCYRHLVLLDKMYCCNATRLRKTDRMGRYPRMRHNNTTGISIDLHHSSTPNCFNGGNTTVA